MVIIKKTENDECFKGMENLELGTAVENVKWCRCYRKQYYDSSKN
jgi:hypothetical protein